MGIKIINISNPLIKNKYLNKSLIFDIVCRQIYKFINELNIYCSEYKEECSSNNGSTLINNVENYLLEISFKYVSIPVSIEYHFCDNKDIDKIINNISIIINYKEEDIIYYSYLLDKINKLKIDLCSNSKNEIYKYV